ncbi:MAG: family 78 glycoside hydrolase catalytic domain [Opitutales bacterium]
MRFLLFLLLGISLCQAHITTDLRVGHLAEPVGVDDAFPSMSWRMDGEEAGLRQTAYQVVVASNPALLDSDKADLWDSGRIESTSTFIKYEGKALPSSQWVYWKVRTWHGNKSSDWSKTQRFLTARIDSEPSAPYISFKDKTPFHKKRNQLHLPPARYYRSTFEPRKPITSAIAHASALGIYELHLNGKKVGDAFFAPGWTNYRMRAYYNSYDLTPLLQNGENAIGAVVADGWYAGYVGYGKLVGYGPNKTGRNIYGKTPALMVEIHLTYADGSTEIVTTNPEWKTTTGPEYEADFLMGEAYDARKELSGWATVDYDDSAWEQAILAKDNGSHKQTFFDRFIQEEREFGFVRPPVLQAYPAPLVRITEKLAAKSINEIKPGVWIFDLGQNIAGNVELKVKAEPGQKFTLRFGEMLHPDGRLMTENLRRARATDTYIAKGTPGGESWIPRFTFHGFQYVEVTGFKKKPSLDAITGLVLHSDTPLTSGFESSDPMLDKIVQNAIWTQRGNWIDLPTDCPQRDERMGWTGDAQIYAETAAIHADVAAFFRKWLRELEDSMTPEGYYPSYAPYPFGHGGAVHGSAWSCAGVIVPHSIWKATGDPAFFAEHWAAMNRFMQARKKHNPKLVAKPFGAPWGDWLNLNDPTPPAYVELAYFAYCCQLMEEMAAYQGFDEQAATYRKWGETLRANFRKSFLKPNGQIHPESQSAYVLALDCGLLTDEAERKKAGDRLAQLIRSKAGPDNTGMTTGFLGSKPLLPMLTATGHYDLAVSLVQSRQYPSWGYEVVNGATTIWERWNSYTKEHGFGGPNGKMNASMNSFSHYAFGAVTAWVFHEIAGIAPAEPGYKVIRLRPRFPTAAPAEGVPPLTWVKAHHDSPHGRIAIHWKKQSDASLLYEVTVPPNTTAQLTLPKRSPWIEPNSGTELRELQPGTYSFEVK